MIPGSGRSPGEASGNAVQYFAMGSHVDREARWATSERVGHNLQLNSNSKVHQDCEKYCRELNAIHGSALKNLTTSGRLHVNNCSRDILMQ